MSQDQPLEFANVGAQLAEAVAQSKRYAITRVDSVGVIERFISADVAAGLGVELGSLDEMCAAADYLTLHLPSTPDTKHLFDDDRFARCKAGVRLINTARGDLIDAEALRRAIERGVVAAAALDVFETEPPNDWALAKLPQVIATPHIAASTEEAQELVGLETAAAVRDLFGGNANLFRKISL